MTYMSDRPTDTHRRLLTLDAEILEESDHGWKVKLKDGRTVSLPATTCHVTGKASGANHGTRRICVPAGVVDRHNLHKWVK
jgi:hypothetical protein